MGSMGLLTMRAVSALLCLVLTSHNSQGNPQSATAAWMKVDAGPFSIFAPWGWEFHQLEGVDSFVGEFIGDGVTLEFDFGKYSNPLKEERKPAYVVVHKSIGGFRKGSQSTNATSWHHWRLFPQCWSRD